MFKFEYLKKVPSPEGKTHYRPRFERSETIEEFEKLPKAIERFTLMYYALLDGEKIEGDPQVIKNSEGEIVFSRDYLGD